MAHCGYEPTAVAATFARPFEALRVAMRGVKTEGKMAPEIPLVRQRPAQYVFSRHVEKMLAQSGTENQAGEAQAADSRARAKEAATRN
jgi:hypothetical protein